MPKFNLAIATAAAAYVSSSQVPAACSKLSKISLTANAFASKSSCHLSYKTFAPVHTPWIFSLVLNLVAAVIANAALANIAPTSAPFADAATATAAIAAFANVTAITALVNANPAQADLVKTATAIAIAAATTCTPSSRTHAASASVNRRRIAKSVRSHRNQTE